ncbi:MAG: phage tail assembly chaperone [Rhodobacteraceae bacterium]|nr:phage tail assembly chaperone [Paracoccaceae bacterium]
MKRFDWPALMRLGLGQLRLTPAQFWALTPAELALMAGLDGARAMDRSGLAELMAKYPDKEE